MGMLVKTWFTDDVSEDHPVKTDMGIHKFIETHGGYVTPVFKNPPKEDGSYMRFGDALSSIQTASLSKMPNFNMKGMRLPHWSPEVVIRVQVPDENSKMTAPYLYVESRFGRVPWIATMIELFSLEWELVD